MRENENKFGKTSLAKNWMDMEAEPKGTTSRFNE